MHICIHIQLLYTTTTEQVLLAMKPDRLIQLVIGTERINERINDQELVDKLNGGITVTVVIDAQPTPTSGDVLQHSREPRYVGNATRIVQHFDQLPPTTDPGRR